VKDQGRGGTNFSLKLKSRSTKRSDTEISLQGGGGRTLRERSEGKNAEFTLTNCRVGSGGPSHFTKMWETGGPGTFRGSLWAGRIQDREKIQKTCQTSTAKRGKEKKKGRG